MITIEDILKQAGALLAQEHIPDAGLDAWYLMEYCFGIDRRAYLMNPRRPADEALSRRYLELIERRRKHVPLQYITGEQEFMGLTFRVDENVLIPRQDTELLVEEVLGSVRGKRVLDMCTGSGCIIISLAVLGQPAEAWGVDISAKALDVAAANAAANSTDVRLVQSDLFDNIEGRFDIIVSNPPYIETHVLQELMEEVKGYEPVLALDGKEDGLYFYKRIIEQAEMHINDGGAIFFEIGYNQGEQVKTMLEDSGNADTAVIKDLNGLDRVVKGRKRRSINV